MKDEELDVKAKEYADTSMTACKIAYSYTEIEGAFYKAFKDGYKECEKEHSAEIDVLKRELQAEKNMRQYWHDEYCKAVDKK